MKSTITKFNVLTIISIIAASLIIGIYMIWQHQINAIKGFTQNGEKTALMLAKNIEHAVLSQELLKINTALQGLTTDPDIAYITVYTKNHDPLIINNYYGLSELPSKPKQLNIKVVSETHLSPKDNKSYLNVITPIYISSQTVASEDISQSQPNTSELIGYLQLGISQESINNNLKQFIQQTLLVILIILSLGVIFTLAQTRWFIRSIKKGGTSSGINALSKEIIAPSKNETTELILVPNNSSKAFPPQAPDEALEKFVTQRTQDLQTKIEKAYHLIEQQKSAHKAKNESFTTKINEIHTPLSGLLGMTELLLNTDLNTQQRKLADTTLISAQSLLRIINSISDSKKTDNIKPQVTHKNLNQKNTTEPPAASDHFINKPFTNKEPKLSRRILLAEDNPVNQEVGVAILRTMGYDPDVVNNGLEALEASTKKRYDAILMDCHMPEMDGFQATHKIRAHETVLPKQQHTPIIALTADVQGGITKQCFSAGMDAYLCKPFTRKQLLTTLEKWLPFIKHHDIKHFSSDQTALVSHTTVHIINPVTLGNLRHLTTETGGTLLESTVTLFLDTAPKEILALQRALDQKDNVALSDIALSFKSTCTILGAQSLADDSAKIESISGQGTTQGVDQHLSKIKSDLPEVINALKQAINTPSIQVETNLTVQTETSKPQHRILLIDNDVNFRLMTSAALTAAEFVVDEANHCLHALEKIKQHKPDLVILDIQVDENNSSENYQSLRNNPIMTDVPIISIGSSNIASIQHAFDSGAADFIAKPLNYAIVIHRIGFILRASQDSLELRNSKLQLTVAQRMARLGYWVWDVKRNHFEISEHLADLCNIDLQKFNTTLEGFLNLIEPGEQLMVKSMIQEAPFNETTQHIEYQLKVVQSEAIFVHQEMSKIIENGQPIITGTVQDISHRKASEQQIHRLAYFDTLTGLASRTYFHERIETFIRTADRRDEKFAFLFLDLDGFKDINDTLGHNQGDELLKKIAKRVQREIRDVDFAARLGGDEFCILLSGIVDDTTVAEVACRCLENINKPLILNQQRIRPRVSIGIAIYPRDGGNEEEIMKSADTAMYAAKQAGKQCYTFYTQDMALQAISRFEREQMLLEAFEEEQFMLHFQPQISMQSGQMIGIEALVRWQHPIEGMVPPDEFIPEIEQLGLIIPLGNWVIKAACEQIAEWHQSGLPYLHVAVNISALHFQDATLLDTVQNVLDNTGVPAHYLELEVTESAMHVEECLDIIKQLRAIGIQIAIDDFGTGYSCLASLKQLPFDSLKIDKVFVDDMLTNHHTSLLLGTIIGLANALDYKIVAEGVENKEQALVMHGLGCHIIQGYLFGRPVSKDKIPELINVDFTHKIETEQ